ncbi:hypothetical protein IAG41_09945 [Sphingomonas sp. JC676]|uniref:hypothetical protein n=1 Tax=Sphingomonas sp. JC676 TaxID=2768065 RepID=UPI00165854A2|nr:hypothetical protein [Sphingomonas sp. JC676]MBC9032712.1 hypothetical protein [Sphingomonas sp. JC676]
MPSEYPAAGTIMSAMVIGAAAATGPMLILSYGFGIFLLPPVLPITCLHAALIAAPLYYSLRRWIPLDWISCAIGGAVVGGAPVALAVGVPAMMAGADPIDMLKALAFFAGSGLIGGVAFYGWIIRDEI